MRALIVDDSSTLREQVRRVLEADGFEVHEAADGIDGLQRIRAMGPGVVVCDVNMPRMNGLEMLETMRNDGLWVPVVMLTTEGAPELIARAKEAGAKGWMTKPLNPELLVSAVRRLHDRFVVADGGSR